MSLPLFALATGSEIILTNESHTVNVQVGLETLVKVLENSKAPHGLHSPFSDPSYQRSGGPPPRVPWQHSSLSSDHVWTNELVEAFSWGYLSTSSVAQVPSGTEVSVTLASREPVSGPQHWQDLLDGGSEICWLKVTWC